MAKALRAIKSLNGNFERVTPRDRTGAFSPKRIKKHQATLSDAIKGKTIGLYGLGMSDKNIASYVQEMYGLEVSSGP